MKGHIYESLSLSDGDGHEGGKKLFSVSSSSHSNIHYTSRRKSRPGTIGQILKAVILACIVIQSLSLVPNLLKSFRNNFTAHRVFSNTNVTLMNIGDPAEQWKDDIWPIRELTPWDISTDFSYPRILEYDVEEGTWLRLDVHPKSGEIVFDMLGDIYCLSAESYTDFKLSEAHLILGGIPHDSDPHFSPDGTKLIFRSDAELGVENIWIEDWSSCENMKLSGNDSRNLDFIHALASKDEDDRLLVVGIRETTDRKQRRLIREGRAGALRVTNETFRWVSDARFHPSGKKLVATKWYTSARSLGAGEGWEYKLPKKNEKISVGSGRRLVGRQLAAGWSADQYGDQQVGPEQFIWRGEDSLIYAKNVIDIDGQYTYSKDVHSGIYAIFSRNLTTNETETLVSNSPGGASRPEISRDGMTLAFVRRVRDKEALVLKDLQTGTLHNIWHGLTYDLSTISAPMGTYPSFSFTPDDNAIIIWADGKLWHVPLSQNSFGERILGGEPQIIPFRAHIKKRIAETRSSITNLISLETADEQRLYAFKDLDVDETGSRVVFHAAGVTYVQDIDDETPAKKVPVLHSGQTYYSPSFVPGSNNLIIHARWSDARFTAFELADLSSGKAYEMSEGLPFGRYRSPVVCECSGHDRKLAFVKTGGDILTGDVVATADPGLYIADIRLPHSSFSQSSRGSRAIKLTGVRYINVDIDVSDVIKMRFSQGSSKLHIEQSRRSFVVDLSKGPDEFGKYNITIIVEGRISQEITTPSTSSGSLDSGPCVAFADLFNVYVLNNETLGGESVWSKPGNSPKGLARVSLDGGHSIRWSRDGKKLFWLLGPFIHALKISELSKCESAVEDDSETFGISCTKDLLSFKEIYITYTTDVHRLKQEAKLLASLTGHEVDNADVLAITNATVLTMESGRLPHDLVEDASIVIRGGIIEQIGRSSEVFVPQGATTINAEGGTVLPGFIDIHAHWEGFGNPIPASSWELQTFLAYGVTTLHNPSSDNVEGFVERARVENGGMIGPRIFHTGNIIYGAGNSQYFQGAVDPAEAYSALVRIKAEGGPASFSYKNYNQYSRASRQRLLLAARNLSMICVPEGGMNQDWDLTYIIDGMTTIEHPLPIPKLFQDVKLLYALSGTASSPTHIVNYGGAFGEELVWAHADIPNDPKLRLLTPHDILESITESTARPLNSYAFFNTSASIAEMVKEGLRTHIGAHGEPPKGFNYHTEMHYTKMGGLDNFEVFRAATIDAAITLGIDSSLGSITPGKLADLVVYPPGVDLITGSLAPTRDIRYVMRGGRTWDASTMVEIWPRKGKIQSIPQINAE